MCEAQMTEFIFSHLCWHQRHLRVVNMTVLNPGGISLKQTCAWWRCAIYILSIVSWTNLLFVSRVNYCTIACPYFQPLYNTYNLFSIDSHTRRENSLSLSSIMHYCWICAMKYPYCLERVQSSPWICVNAQVLCTNGTWGPLETNSVSHVLFDNQQAVELQILGRVVFRMFPKL